MTGASSEKNFVAGPIEKSFGLGPGSSEKKF
jgi:hypothetical protein